MIAFPGAHRRVWVKLPSGQSAHIPRHRRAQGPQTWCGATSGVEASWTEVRDLALCATCGSLSGLFERIGRWAAASGGGDQRSGRGSGRRRPAHSQGASR